MHAHEMHAYKMPVYRRYTAANRQLSGRILTCELDFQGAHLIEKQPVTVRTIPAKVDVAVRLETITGDIIGANGIRIDLILCKP
jgi:hypothetical protein